MKDGERRSLSRHRREVSPPVLWKRPLFVRGFFLFLKRGIKNKERREVYPANGGKSLRLYSLKPQLVSNLHVEVF
jgi:hypothetical protein